MLPIVVSQRRIGLFLRSHIIRPVLEKAYFLGLPVTEKGLAVDVFLRDQSPISRVRRIIAVIAHHIVVMLFNLCHGVIVQALVVLAVKLRLV